MTIRRPPSPVVQDKFTPEDRRYFEDRNRFASTHAEAPFWFVADNWPLLAGSVNIARYLAVYELMKRVNDLPGHVCELGCWNGTNLVFLAKLVSLFRPRTYTEVIGFDSFEGLQRFDPEHDPRAAEGAYKGDIELLEDALKLHGLDACVRLVKGNLEETLPRFLNERQDIRFSFVYLDVDLYAPTKLAVELLYPKLLSGGIMVFDEYNLRLWPGETRGVHDVLGDGVVLQSIPWTRQPSAYLVKP